MEFETAGDLKVAVDKLDNQEFKGANVRCIADVCHSPTTPCMCATKQHHRLRMRFHATTASVLVLLLPLVVDPTHLVMAITIVDHLRVPIALDVKTIVVAPHLLVTITTLVIAATVPHHLAPVVHLSMIRIHPLLVAVMVEMSMADLLLVAVMMTPTLPMGTTNVGLDHHPLGVMKDMMGAQCQDTGEFPSFLCWG